MTLKEIHEFLINTKVYVNCKSKEIQEKLFLLGYTWNYGSIEVNYTRDPFLFIDEEKAITRSSNMEYFTNKNYREISAEEIISLEFTEHTYRPFKDKKECWNEMLKHQPFGWIRDNYSNTYKNITVVHNEKVELTPYFTYDNETLQDFILYQDIIKRYTFADGKTFGIKED